MVTPVIIVLSSLLVALLASKADDRNWLYDMMLRLPNEDPRDRSVFPTYDPTWPMVSGLSEGRPFGDTELKATASDPRNYDSIYSMQGFSPEAKSAPENMEKKWSRHQNFHFSGFICCNQPPTPGPHPKPKRRRGPVRGGNFRNLLLKDIARTVSSRQIQDRRPPLLAEQLNQAILDDAHAKSLVDPSFLDMPMMRDDLTYLEVDGNPVVQRRGVTVRARRRLPPFVDKVLSPSGVGKRGPPDYVTAVGWNDGAGGRADAGFYGNPFKRNNANNSDPKFRDYFRSLGGGR